jgi:hypothetical protein
MSVDDMAPIVVFPLARRLGQIRNQARSMACRPDDTAERYLARYPEIQRETLVRRGIDTEIMNEQCRDMEVAIRWTLIRVMDAGENAA